MIIEGINANMKYLFTFYIISIVSTLQISIAKCRTNKIQFGFYVKLEWVLTNPLKVISINKKNTQIKGIPLHRARPPNPCLRIGWSYNKLINKPNKSNLDLNRYYTF